MLTPTTSAPRRSVALDGLSQLLRLAVLVVPGATLLVVSYSLDYPYPDVGAYPAHIWSTAVAVAGFWLLLVALVLMSGDALSPWVALLSAIAIGNVGAISDGLIVPAVSSWIGVLGTALVVLLAASSVLVRAFGWRHWGRAVIASLVVSAVGVGAFVLNAALPTSPIWNGPPGLLVALLVATPAFVVLKKPGLWSRRAAGTARPEPSLPVASPSPERPTPVATSTAASTEEARSLFRGGVFGQEYLTASLAVERTRPDELTPQDRQRFGPPKRVWLAGCPWWGWIYVAAFLWSVGDAELPLRMVGLRDPWLTLLAIVAVALMGAGIVILGPKIRSWALLWLDPWSRAWNRLDSRAFALQKSATTTLESDPNLSQAAALYKQALELAEVGGRPLLVAAACNNLASVYAEQNRMQDAIPYFERSLQLRTAYAGAANDATVGSIQRLAMAYSAAGRQSDANVLNARFS